jgi:transposase
MLKEQSSLILSPYIGLYDILVPEDHELRQIGDLVDFSFVLEELRDKYSPRMGRGSVDPIYLFKLLLLKKIYNNLSDRDLVKRASTDLAIKYFLDIAPEDPIVHHTTLTKFRRLRLTDEGLLDLLVKKTVEIADEQGVLKSKTIIMDATHTFSKYNKKKPLVRLRELGKNFRQKLYSLDETLIEKVPAKYSGDNLEGEIRYVRELAEVVKANDLYKIPMISEALHTLEEFAEDSSDMYFASCDKDAAPGYKSEDNSFFGYKSHIAMNEDRIITAAVVTPGNEADGKQFSKLVDKTKENGLIPDTVLADGAYSSKENYTDSIKKEVTLISKMNSRVTGELERTAFTYNKDADQVICKGGKQSDRKDSRETKTGSIANRFYFHKSTCKGCPNRVDCWKGKERKSFTITTPSETQQLRIAFQNSDEFKIKYKNRYMIEAKNNELKNRHGLKNCNSGGLFGMQIDAATSIFVTNIKRIITLKAQSTGE